MSALPSPVTSSSKPRRGRKPVQNLFAPTPERIARALEAGDAIRLGGIDAPARAHDAIGRMVANGSIDGAQHAAAEKFAGDFRQAGYDTLRARAIPSTDIRGTTTDIAPVVLSARRRLLGAIEVLGGQGSQTLDCAWHVLGLEDPVSEWTRRMVWTGRTMNAHRAQGILLAALDVLAGYYKTRR
jgi:hypothetical protein